MKIYIIGLLSMILIIQNIKSQNKFKINPIIGIRLHQLDGHGYPSYKYRQVATSPIIGLEIKNEKNPIILSYRFNYLTELDNLRDSTISLRNESAVQAIFREHQIDIYYIFKKKNNQEKFRIGLGHLWEKKENIISYIFDNIPRSGKSVTLSVMIPTKWLKIEFKEKVEYQPDLAAFDKWKHSINFLYDFEKNKNTEHKNLIIGFLMGLRAFPITYKNTGGFERYDKIGISGQLGLEFYVPKFRTSFNIERDWWIALSGGNPIREIKGYITTSIVGLRYHHPLKNEKNIKIGIGASYITDNEQMQAVKERLLAPGFTPPDSDLFFYNLKGIALSLSYSITKHIDSEFRHTVVLKGEDKYSVMRSSLGIIYRLNFMK
jgi:hypothetical protein